MQYNHILIGEYSNYILTDEGTAHTHDNNKLIKYNLPEKVIPGAAGHPYGYVIGDSGALYMLTGDSPTFSKIADNVKLVDAYWDWAVVVGKDNVVTLYQKGVMYARLKPMGDIVQVSAAHYILFRLADGDVLQFNWASIPWKSGVVWQKTAAVLSTLDATEVILPGRASHVTTSRLFFSAAIVNGVVYGWCDAFGAKYLGFPGVTTIPKGINTPEAIVVIEASDNAIHMIGESGSLYGMGGLGVGEVGNGKKEPEVIETGGWPNMVVKTMVPPTKLNDRKYTKVFAGSGYGFRHFALEDNGLLNSWGYGKFGLLLNGIRPQDDSSYVGAISVAAPRRVTIPDVLVPKTTAEIKAMTYPPAEATVPEPPPPVRKAIATLYDDGTWEEVK